MAIRIDSARNLTPGEFSSPGEIASDIAHGLIDQYVSEWHTPDRRAVYVGAIPTAIVCARAGLPFLAALGLSLAAGAVTRWAYLAVEDIRAGLHAGHDRAPGCCDAAGDV